MTTKTITEAQLAAALDAFLRAGDFSPEARAALWQALPSGADSLDVEKPSPPPTPRGRRGRGERI